MSINNRLARLENRVRPSAGGDPDDFDLDRLTPGEREKLSTFLSRMEDTPKLPDGRPDFSAWEDDELRLLSALISKAAGQHDIYARWLGDDTIAGGPA